MKIALSWLRQLVATEASAEELAHRLTMAGIEVEDIAVAPAFTQVVVARVASVARHPNADRLTVCQVDTGGPGLRTVVCGAPNVAAGLLVPCALPGAVLSGGLAIRSSKVRGEASDGMLCSAKELGLSEEAAGLMVLEEGAAPGTDLRAFLDLDDPVLEIKTTPNRGDCQSAFGLARELAAITGLPLAAPAVAAVAPTSDERLAVHVEAHDLCGRFSGRVLRGLDARAPTPAWMRRRLEQCGQRSISALVDISNFVMLELGQPSHVFDLAKVRGSLTVRWGLPGERVTLLNEHTVELDANVGVVADDNGPEAVAGIMGGLSTSVTLDTTDIYLEAAFWWPESIQGRPRRLNLASEAAHRFERGVDFARTRGAIERLTQLINQICGTPGTRIGPLDDQQLRLPARPPVRLRHSRLERVLGLRIAREEVEACFARLRLPCVALADGYQVAPPSFRFDLEREEDLIEEVARIHGFDKIPAEPPLARARMRARPEARRSEHELRRSMAAAGYQELVNFSFVPESWEAEFGADPARSIRVLNPIAAQHTVMRSQLGASLVDALRYNLNRQASRVRVCELARVFQRDPEMQDGDAQIGGIAQPTRLAALAYGPAMDEQWGVASRPVDFFDVKGDLEALLAPAAAHFSVLNPGSRGFAALHPGRSAAVELTGEAIGWIGELHPRLCKLFDLPAAPILFEVDVLPLLVRSPPDLQEVPRFPALVRDIAIWMDNSVPAGEVLNDLRALALQETRLAAVREVKLFDVFRPPALIQQDASALGSSGLLIKEKSLAFRIVLQDTQRSLAEADADAARATIVEHLLRRWGGRERQ